MKKLFLSLSLILIALLINAQTTIPVNDYGSGNLGIGNTPLSITTGASWNIGIGGASLTSLTGGTSNIAIGAYSLKVNTMGASNCAVGTYALQANTTGTNNVAVGPSSLYWNTTGSGNIGVGMGAGGSGSGVFDGNTLVGHQTGFNGSTPYSYNTALGYKAGYNLFGNSNVMLGYFAGAYEMGSNTFYLDNQDRTNTTNEKTHALMYGKFDQTPANQILAINANVGIGTTTAPQAKLDVAGNIIFGIDGSYNLLSGRATGGAIQFGTNSATWDRNLNLGFIDNTRAFSSIISLIHQTGYVGIGTTTPSSILQIAKADSKPNLDLTNSAALDIWNPDGNGNTGGQINFRSDANTGSAGIGAVIGYLNKNSDGNGSSGDLVFGVKNTNTDASVIHAMTIQQGGNVGIGTNTPGTKLEIGVPHASNQNEAMRIGSYSDANTFWGLGLNYRLDGNGNPTGHLVGYEGSSNFDALSINLYNKRIGIGTANPDELLTVNGVIHAKEVKVDLTGSLADYVFHPSYKLMPLTQVEQYVNANSHLPEMPSASEVSKNGMNMGDMQNKLLQKVEELTLYAIELQKTVNQQNARIEELEKNK